MLPRILTCALVLAYGVLVLAGTPAPAGDKKADKLALSGTWSQKGAELKLEFADKDVLKIAPHGDSAVIAIVCKYTVEKPGRVSASITGFEGNKEEAKKKIGELLPIGSKFSFTWTAKEGVARLEEVKGDNADLLKNHLVGEFEQKK